ncbi:hypothetical protein GXW78_10790 [Roseomonas terrae]|uniref:Uncharacterized protein n=1 Tax=Neoroseomonas terrae TaxID=424799 RepID=A0ABS5EGQ3_9PROT|nr:hypothetical protein [Neoroseomonas terrae]MBR0650150.1 hypothetical protein [Neoroseomonas terrae]
MTRVALLTIWTNGQLRSAVDDKKEVEPALGDLHLRDSDVKEADTIRLERPLDGPIAFDLR